VVGHGEPGHREGRDEQSEVAQRDVVVVARADQVDDDAGQPGGDDVAADAGRKATSTPAAISTTPTTIMMVWALKGSRSVATGAR
jgi:hypothetical protein